MNTFPLHRLSRWATVLVLLVLLVLLGACGEASSDAHGNFEATEITVAAEAGGRLLRLDVEEGAQLPQGALVGQVDTSTLALQRRELIARREAARAKTGEAEATATVLRTQRGLAERELERTRRLLAVQAATSQQGDRAERDARLLGDQLTGVQATKHSVSREVAAIDAQVATMDDRLLKSRIVTPGAGTILTRYAEAGEYVQPGTALFKMAALDTLILRAYVSGAQLAQVALGQSVQVLVDAGADSLRTLSGRVTWIAAAAEFTPTPIQTRDERTTQVYAIKVAVPNDRGRLRIGMPGEVRLKPPVDRPKGRAS